MPDKSAKNALYLLRDIFHYVKTKHIDDYFISLDIEKAFDTVNFDLLGQAFSKVGFSSHSVKIS